MRASSAELREAKRLATRLDEWTEADPPGTHIAVAEMSRLLGARTLTYAVEPEVEGFRVSDAYFSHPAEYHFHRFRGLFLPGPSGWGTFDPLRPPAAQRNRAVATPSVARSVRLKPSRRRQLGVRDQDWPSVRNSLRRTEAVYSRFGWERLEYVRVLVCDGGALVAWVGATSEEAFSRREEDLLGRIAPALVRRLKLERDLGMSRLNASALECALERIGAPAFLIDGRGGLARANAEGRRIADADRPALAATLRASLAGTSDAYSVTRIVASGLRGHALAVGRAPRPGRARRLAEAKERWELTDRQAAVLERLVRGESNKTIGATLGLAEGTIELRVTQLLQRAGVVSRAALAAAFWAGDA